MNEFENEAPKVSGAPETIWLVYGDLERDDTHDQIYCDTEIFWSHQKEFASDIRYVRADIADALRAEIERLRSDNAKLAELLEYAMNSFDLATDGQNVWYRAAEKTIRARGKTE